MQHANIAYILFDFCSKSIDYCLGKGKNKKERETSLGVNLSINDH